MKKFWSNLTSSQQVVAAMFGAIGLIAAAVVTGAFDLFSPSTPGEGTSSDAPQTALEDVSPIEKRLNAANVRLTGSPESTARVRTNFETDAALQTLGREVLAVMGRQHLRKSLHLDVINGKYKLLLTGNPSGEYLPPERYDNQEKLREAMILHWNELYPDYRVQSFPQMLE